MTRRPLVLAAALVAWAPLAAWAQTTPGGTLGPPPGGTIGEEEPKKQGVAEKAPKEQAQLPTLPPLPPYPGQDKKKFELIEIDGYFRLRANWLDNFHLGFRDTGDGAPFGDALACRDASTDPGHQPANPVGCGGSIGTSNIRARFEPTINLSETVAFHLQIDALDNVVLGSTPSGWFLDTGVVQDPVSMNTGQTVPEDGENAPWDSIRVKRAWADVKTPLGALRFGRMPSHWGMGMFSNSGGYDPINDSYCTDCDHGDTVDRFMFGTTVPGTQIRAAVGFDWAATGPTAGQLATWRFRHDGQPHDFDDGDDVTQWVIVLARLDDPETWRATLREGRTAFNYGIQFFYRNQSFETRAPAAGNPADATFISRNATSYIPDVWLRLTTGKLTLEAEAAGVFGSIDNIIDPVAGESMTLASWGAVARLTYLLLDDDLELTLESGFASGDEWDDEDAGNLHIDIANYLPRAANDTTISHFEFNRNYRVDLILWKELYGAVTNALYVKPRVRYNITERFFFSAAAIGSFAHKSVATPGNEALYGIELDGEIGYRNEKEGFFAGLYYGVLFPLAALDHPLDLFPNEASGGGASTAQTFQGRFVLKF
jgi:uncharacterized protein (TIGR04551 family)